MAIIPDDKNWTWVLDRVCPECGLLASGVSPTEVGAGVRANAGAWRELLARPEARLRPSDDRWSGVEYGCHVRDVFRLYDYRLGLMLDHDDPLFPNWDQDATAIEERYDLADAAVVADELAGAAEALAARFDLVGADDWQRSGRRSDGVAFTIATFAQYMLHDPIHHVWDVEQGYALLAAA